MFVYWSCSFELILTYRLSINLAPSFAPAVSSASFVPSQPAPAPSQTIVQKHIYVHVPPPDQDELAQQLPVQQGATAQKHYKIIFIKAPSGPSVAQQLAQIAPQSQSEEKTLVYVLVKKPESLEEIQQSIPRAPAQQPSKPEVYFIKYKAQTQTDGFGQSQPIGLSSPSLQAGASDFSAASQSGFASSASQSGFSAASHSGFSGQSISSGSAELSPSFAAPISSFESSARYLTDYIYFILFYLILNSRIKLKIKFGIFSGASSLAVHSSGGDVANIGDIIQPRTPAAEYGPPKH